MPLLLVCALNYKLIYYCSVVCIFVNLFSLVPLLVVLSSSLHCLCVPVSSASVTVFFPCLTVGKVEVKFNNNHVNWEHKLVVGFFTRLNKKSYDVRCALSYRWFVEGGFTVSRFSQFYYLIKFEYHHENGKSA